MLPQAIATGYIHIGTMAGKLNGVMPAQTPSGWRSECVSISGPTLRENSPFRRCGMPQANSTTSMPRATSPSASACVLPCSPEIGARDVGGVLVEQLLEPEHEARALQRRRAAPGGRRLLRGRDRGVDLGRARQAELRRLLAGRRIEHRRDERWPRMRRDACRRWRSDVRSMLAVSAMTNDPMSFRSSDRASRVQCEHALTAASSGRRASLPTSSSISLFWMISGGDMAMMSPVVRIMMPSS